MPHSRSHVGTAMICHDAIGLEAVADADLFSNIAIDDVSPLYFMVSVNQGRPSEWGLQAQNVLTIGVQRFSVSQADLGEVLHTQAGLSPGSKITGLTISQQPQWHLVQRKLCALSAKGVKLLWNGEPTDCASATPCTSSSAFLQTLLQALAFPMKPCLGFRGHVCLHLLGLKQSPRVPNINMQSHKPGRYQPSLQACTRHGLIQFPHTSCGWVGNKVISSTPCLCAMHDCICRRWSTTQNDAESALSAPSTCTCVPSSRHHAQSFKPLS